MLDRFLICNQYELGSSFDEIRKLPYFARLMEIHGEQSLSDENLYRMLGYQGVGKLSIANTVELRRAIISGNSDQVMHALEKSGITCRGPAELNNIEKNLYIDFLAKKKIMEHNTSPAVEMAVRYVFTTKDFNFVIQNTKLTFNEYLNWIACSNCSMRESDIQDSLISKIKFVETTSVSHACNGVVYVNPNEWKSIGRKIDTFAVSLAREICRRKGYIKKLKISNVSDIMFLWCNTLDKYVLLLDWSAALGLTFSNFLQFIGAGVRVLNQQGVLSEIDMAMYTCGDNIIYAVPGTKSLRKDKLINIESVFRLRDMNLACVSNMNAF